MIKPAKKSINNLSQPRSAQKSKFSPLNQSTRINQSQSTNLSFPQRPNPSLSSNTKFHQCCNSIKNHHHSFQPTVNCLPFELYPQNWTNISRSKKEQWENLTQDNRMRTIQRTQQKMRQEQERLRECTFSPGISQFQPSYPKQQNDEDIHTKLYQEAQTKRQSQLLAEKQELQKKRLEIQAFQNKEYDASKWKILNTERFDLEPLYKRLEKVLEQKKKNRKMIAEKEQVNYPFQPEVNQASKVLVEKKGVVENVVDRLIKDFMKRQNRINVLRENMQINLKKQCTFSPAINNYLPTQHPKINKDRTDTPQSLFTPSINPLSSLMMQDRSNQTSQQKYYRMIQTPAIKKADHICQIQAQVYAQCCFNPEINDISRQIQGVSQKHHICQVKKEEAPTHRPSINQMSRLMSQSKRAKSLDNIKKKIKQKQQHYKQHSQYSKMKECTFKPNIKDNKQTRNKINSQMTLHDVAGFQQFYETREKYYEKEKSRKILEERLFQLQKSYDLRMSRMK